MQFFYAQITFYIISHCQLLLCGIALDVTLFSVPHMLYFLPERCPKLGGWRLWDQDLIAGLIIVLFLHLEYLYNAHLPHQSSSLLLWDSCCYDATACFSQGLVSQQGFVPMSLIIYPGVRLLSLQVGTREKPLKVWRYCRVRPTPPSLSLSLFLHLSSLFSMMMEDDNTLMSPWNVTYSWPR